MNRAVLDSDTLSEVEKQIDPTVVRHARQYRRAHGRYTFSAYSRFEVERDLILRGRGSPRHVRFQNLSSHSDIIPVTDDILDEACDLWVIATAGGHPRDDGDLLIAATALQQQVALVTGNTAHFDWIPGLTLLNWRRP